MPEPIGPYSPEEIIEAIETSLIDQSLSVGRSDQSVVFRGSDVRWVYTGFPILNRVLGAKFKPDEAEDRIAEIAECFRRWKAPVAWIMGPSSWPPLLAQYLEESGFTATETWTGMAMDLQKADLPSLGKRPAAHFQIKRISTEKELNDWTLINTGPWPADVAAASTLFSLKNAGSDSRCHYYLGYLNGKAAVRGMILRSGDIVGLHWIDTLAESRDTDYDTWLTSQMLLDAKTAAQK